MNRPTRMTLIATCLAGGFGLAFAASAQQPVAADAQVSADVAQVDVAQAEVQSDALVANSQPGDKNVRCLTQTGTRINTRDPKTGKAACQGPGRNYSRDDIDRTGQTDLADALRRLDPSIR